MCLLAIFYLQKMGLIYATRSWWHDLIDGCILNSCALMLENKISLLGVIGPSFIIIIPDHLPIALTFERVFEPFTRSSKQTWMLRATFFKSVNKLIHSLDWKKLMYIPVHEGAGRGGGVGGWYACGATIKNVGIITNDALLLYVLEPCFCSFWLFFPLFHWRNVFTVTENT